MLKNSFNTEQIDHFDSLWGRLWKLPITPKLKHVLWRLRMGCVGVFGRLKERHIKETVLVLDA